MLFLFVISQHRLVLVTGNRRSLRTLENKIGFDFDFSSTLQTMCYKIVVGAEARVPCGHHADDNYAM
jgi:hypothetical protein